ncbi:MAG TPA: hypothetical protein VF247_09410 [Candidatus Krumholzibacteria bacterium]
MKRSCFAVLLAVSAILLTHVPAAHAFGIMGSWWNIDKSNEDGWGGGIRQEVPLIPWGWGDNDSTDGDNDADAEEALIRLSLDTRASYFRFSDADLNVIPLEVGGLIGLGVLYAELGGGYYIMDADYDVQNDWGWFALAGVMLGRGATGLFGEVKWTSLTADIDNVDVDLGDIPNSLDADGVGINVGISFGI